MPEMDGFETLQKIQKNFSNLDVPVAFLTAHKSLEMIERASAMGSNTFLLKPIDPSRLLQRINMLVGGARPL